MFGEQSVGWDVFMVFEKRERSVFENAIKESGVDARVGAPNEYFSPETHCGLYGRGNLTAMWRLVYAAREKQK